MQIKISWLLKKPTDLDLHCLLRQGMSCSAKEGLMLHGVKISGKDPDITFLITTSKASWLIQFINLDKVIYDDNLRYFLLFCTN